MAFRGTVGSALPGAFWDYHTRVCGGNVDDAKVERLRIYVLGGAGDSSWICLARDFQPPRPNRPHSGDRGVVLFHLWQE